jgi:hypothetical protein
MNGSNIVNEIRKRLEIGYFPVLFNGVLEAKYRRDSAVSRIVSNSDKMYRDLLTSISSPSMQRPLLLATPPTLVPPPPQQRRQDDVAMIDEDAGDDCDVVQPAPAPVPFGKFREDFKRVCENVDMWMDDAQRFYTQYNSLTLKDYGALAIQSIKRHKAFASE